MPNFEPECKLCKGYHVGSTLVQLGNNKVSKKYICSNCTLKLHAMMEHELGPYTTRDLPRTYTVKCTTPVKILLPKTVVGTFSKTLA